MNGRIVLVDDQTLFVQSLTEVLQSTAPDLEVVAVGYSGAEAVDLARTHKPDIVLLDVRMPELSGVSAVRIIHGEFPDIRIVMLTAYDDDEYVKQAVSYGAIGYLLKDMPVQDLIDALRTIKTGAFLLPANIAQKVLRPSTGSVYHGGFDGTSLPEWYYRLSPKERRILRLLVERYSNREIAQIVHFAEQTVKNRLSRIYETIGVETRKDAAHVAERYIHFL